MVQRPMQRTENKKLSQTCENLRECLIHVLYSSFGFVYEYKNMEKYLNPNLFYMKLYFLVEFFNYSEIFVSCQYHRHTAFKGYFKNKCKRKNNIIHLFSKKYTLAQFLLSGLFYFFYLFFKFFSVYLYVYLFIQQIFII